MNSDFFNETILSQKTKLANANYDMSSEQDLNSDLIQNLSQFGLCPFDWSIGFKSKKFAIIKNTSESDFQLIGKLNTSDTNWEYIRLLSL